MCVWINLLHLKQVYLCEGAPFLWGIQPWVYLHTGMWYLLKSLTVIYHRIILECWYKSAYDFIPTTMCSCFAHSVVSHMITLDIVKSNVEQCTLYPIWLWVFYMHYMGLRHLFQFGPISCTSSAKMRYEYCIDMCS